MMCDDAIFTAVSSRYSNVSLPDWARIRNVCKLNMVIIDQSKTGIVVFPNDDKVHLTSELSMFKGIPIVNLIHDFFDSAPNPDGIQLIMNIVLLVDALMLGIALSLPGSMSYDYAIEAIKRFNGEGSGNDLYNEWCVKSGRYHDAYGMAEHQCGWGMMVSFTYQATLSASMLGGSILCMVTLYTFFSVTNFSGPSKLTSYEMVSAWWQVVLCATLLSIILTSGGLMFMFGSVKMLATFNFPDFFLDSNGSYEYMNLASDPRNTVNYYNTHSWGWCVSSFLLAIAVASFGLKRKSVVFKEAYSKVINGDELPKKRGASKPSDVTVELTGERNAK